MEQQVHLVQTLQVEVVVAQVRPAFNQPEVQVPNGLLMVITI